MKYEISGRSKQGFRLATIDEFVGAFKQHSGVGLNAITMEMFADNPKSGTRPRASDTVGIQSFLLTLGAESVFSNVYFVNYDRGVVSIDFGFNPVQIRYGSTPFGLATNLYVRVNGEPETRKIVDPEVWRILWDQLKYQPAGRAKLIEDLQTRGYEIPEWMNTDVLVE